MHAYSFQHSHTFSAYVNSNHEHDVIDLRNTRGANTILLDCFPHVAGSGTHHTTI